MNNVTVPILGIVLFAITSLSAGEWSVKIDYAETCNCKVICQCLFGGEPNNRECLGQAIIQFKEGSYNGVDLTGVNIHWAFKMGGWDRCTVSENATQKQIEAARKVFEIGISTRGGEIVSFEQGPVHLKKTGSRIAYGTTNSSAEIEIVAGADGTPIRIENHPKHTGYEQYRSITHKHESDQAKFAFSDTNGFTSSRIISGE